MLNIYRWYERGELQGMHCAFCWDSWQGIPFMTQWLTDVVNREGPQFDRRSVQKPRRETHVSAFLCPTTAFTPAVKRMVRATETETNHKKKDKHDGSLSKIQKRFL